jgi:hypothetical protein
MVSRSNLHNCFLRSRSRFRYTSSFNLILEKDTSANVRLNLMVFWTDDGARMLWGGRDTAVAPAGAAAVGGGWELG